MLLEQDHAHPNGLLEMSEKIKSVSVVSVPALQYLGMMGYLFT